MRVNKKQFHWDSGMAENLITCLEIFKSQMKYNDVDFDSDCSAQVLMFRRGNVKAI